MSPCNRPPSHRPSSRAATGHHRVPGFTLTSIRDRIVTCERCPRLRRTGERIGREKRRAYRDEIYWARPVPGFGDPARALLIVGLAPAAHGANRTGRVFTGDGVGGSGDFLMSALHRAGFANIPTSQSIDDGLMLQDAYIAAAVRCAPPDNKPTPDEIANCLPHLDAETRRAPPRPRRRRARQDRLRRLPAAAQARGARRCGRARAFGHGVVHALPDRRDASSAATTRAGRTRTRASSRRR